MCKNRKALVIITFQPVFTGCTDRQTERERGGGGGGRERERERERIERDRMR